MQALSFPLRLQENGLLQRQERVASVLGLIQVMARTPAGSWAGTPNFGLRDLFEGQESRIDVPRIALYRLNETFQDLGLSEFVCTEVRRDISLQSGVQQYSITLQSGPDDTTFTTMI